MKHAAPDVRLTAAGVIHAVLHDGRSLADLAADAQARFADERDRAFVQACVFGVLRSLFRLRAELATLLAKPLRGKDADIEALLLVGLFQLREMRLPAHAAVSATVEAARKLGKPWACSLLNGVLRQAQRAPFTPAPDDLSLTYEHPSWLIARLQQDWPDDWARILLESNRQAPLTLRVNTRRSSVEQCLDAFAAAGLTACRTTHSAVGIRLERPAPVASLPGFAQGLLTVQDEAAQLATVLLAAERGQRVLDACAAPGGKTTHLLEASAALDLLALDREPVRLGRVQDNLARLGLTCSLAAADAGTPPDWWDGQPFDRILLDAPCSALGIMRRHPDIRLHRKPDDLPRLAAEQTRLLLALWPLLRAGGRLVYATCSIMPAENDAVIAALLARHDDAVCETVSAAWGRATHHGRQILPGDDEMDGFYYAVLTRQGR